MVCGSDQMFYLKAQSQIISADMPWSLPKKHMLTFSWKLLNSHRWNCITWLIKTCLPRANDLIAFSWWPVKMDVDTMISSVGYGLQRVQCTWCERSQLVAKYHKVAKHT